MPLRYLIPILIGGALAFGLTTIDIDKEEITDIQRGVLPLEDNGKVIESDKLREVAKPLEDGAIKANERAQQITNGGATTTTTTTKAISTTTDDKEEKMELAPEFEFSDKHRSYSVSTPNDPFITKVDVDPFTPSGDETQMSVIRVRSAYEIKSVQITIDSHAGEETHTLERAGRTENGSAEAWKGSWKANDTYKEGYIMTIEVETENNTSSVELHMI